MQKDFRDHIPGWGFDLARENRPGVPKNRHPTRPIGTPHWKTPSRQPPGGAALVSPTRPMTPIHASTVQPRGLSGVLRRAAYRVPEYRPRRWLLAMLADRVDAIEHDLPRAGRFLAGAGALLIGWMFLSRRRARSSPG